MAKIPGMMSVSISIITPCCSSRHHGSQSLGGKYAHANTPHAHSASAQVWRAPHACCPVWPWPLERWRRLRAPRRLLAERCRECQLQVCHMPTTWPSPLPSPACMQLWHGSELMCLRRTIWSVPSQTPAVTRAARAQAPARRPRRARMVARVPPRRATVAARRRQ